MSSFNANSQIYNVVTENELSEVLSHYNSEFIFSIVDDAMKKRFTTVPLTAVPNVVAAWEQNFKAIMATYGMDSKSEVMRVREETYNEIIEMICKEFDLNFTIDDSIDKFSAALHLYNLFVCNFTENLVEFFANFIYKERTALFDALGLAEYKKNKDSSTIYGKKVFKDIKIAIINANIDMVISQICAMDIPFYTIISLICGNNSELKKYYLSIISSDTNFFTKAYVPSMNSDIRPELITSIRFRLQDIAAAHDQTIGVSEIDITEKENNNE